MSKSETFVLKATWQARARTQLNLIMAAHGETKRHVDTAAALAGEAALAVNVIRCFAADMPSLAKSGHPGAPMGCAPMAYVLWSKIMNYAPAHPKWLARDRFVLSNGHACALLYTMLHLTGYDVSREDCARFRQLHSKTPGHPENTLTPGVEVTTGPLGQGLTNAVGMALAQAQLSATFARPGFEGLFDNFTYVICGDGCLQEGITSEAASLAGHLGLGKLILLYDDNEITIDGETSLSFSEDVRARFEAYHWHTQTVVAGDTDLAGLEAAIAAAKAVTDKPSIICVKTTIGFWSKKQGTEAVHGSPLSADDLAQVKTTCGLDPTKVLQVPPAVAEFFAGLGAAGNARYEAWVQRFTAYSAAFPAEAAELNRRLEHRLPENWKSLLPKYTPGGKVMATRSTSGNTLNALAPAFSELIGGSADLTPSNKTELACSHSFQKATPDGRYLRFGVREHAMVAVCNGIYAYGAFRPFCATFLNFIGYAWGAVRVSAISHFPIIMVMTHDSLGVGEDGPTHQPINASTMVRSEPNMLYMRPADGNETSGAYAVAMETTSKPIVLALTRQDLPQLEGSSADAVARGGYVLCRHGEGVPRVILIGTGSEVALCVAAAKLLAGKGLTASVVSMPCTQLFDDQSLDYRESVLTPGVPVMAVEMAAATGWEKYSHAQHCMTTFGASAPAEDAFREFGFVPEVVAGKAEALIAFYASQPVANLQRRPF